VSCPLSWQVTLPFPPVSFSRLSIALPRYPNSYGYLASIIALSRISSLYRISNADRVKLRNLYLLVFQGCVLHVVLQLIVIDYLSLTPW
jgi:hypothetical protein